MDYDIDDSGSRCVFSVTLGECKEVNKFQVVGYSWINVNQMVFANPGIGVSLGWKRA